MLSTDLSLQRTPAVDEEEEFEPEEFEHYEELLNPTRNGHKAPRPPKKMQVIEELVEPSDLEAGFKTTYKPSRHEEGWLLSSLSTFYEQQIVTDVLSVVKGGKEATVYRCAAHPSTGRDLIAAKVYRPQKFRNLSNDKMYRDGRAVLTAEGRAVKESDHRVMRALGKKTAFGLQVQHTSWLMYEYTTLQRLFQAGAAVPEPLAAGENALLMGFVGDAQVPAPTLIEVSLESDEAEPLFQEVLRNIEILLQHGLIHGDLSAYNILYWEGKITLIDFPQVTNSQSNQNAAFILQRDLTRVCDYFSRQGVPCDVSRLMKRLWQRYG